MDLLSSDSSIRDARANQADLGHLRASRMLDLYGMLVQTKPRVPPQQARYKCRWADITSTSLKLLRHVIVLAHPENFCSRGLSISDAVSVQNKKHPRWAQTIPFQDNLALQMILPQFFQQRHPHAGWLTSDLNTRLIISPQFCNFTIRGLRLARRPLQRLA